MVQVLDRYRNAYMEETGKKISDYQNPFIIPKYTIEVPTWDYVCWLEKLLDDNKILIKEPEYTITSTSTVILTEDEGSNVIQL